MLTDKQNKKVRGMKKTPPAPHVITKDMVTYYGKENSWYKWSYKSCIIGLDQSYANTGICVCVDGKVKYIGHIDFNKVTTKGAKRQILAKKLDKLINKCIKLYGADNIAIIVERIRTLTAGNQFRPTVIKAAAAMMAYIVDTAAKYDIIVYSVDTRAWKSAILGTSKPVFEPIEGVTDPQKFGSVRKVVEMGYRDKIYRPIKSKGSKAFKLDDDAADATCIALYGYIYKKFLEIEQ